MREKIKHWVILYSSVTNPYSNSTWYVSVTIAAYDYSGEGTTIEKAYNDLTERIFRSRFILGRLIITDSFKNL